MTTQVPLPPNYSARTRTHQAWSGDGVAYSQRTGRDIRNTIVSVVGSIPATNPVFFYEDTNNNYRVVGDIICNINAADDYILFDLTSLNLEPTYERRAVPAIVFDPSNATRFATVIQWINQAIHLNEDLNTIPANSILTLDLTMYKINNGLVPTIFPTP